MTYILTFSQFQKAFVGKNFKEVESQLNEFAELRKMYICPVKHDALPALDIDTYRINVYYSKDGTITKIEMDERDV